MFARSDSCGRILILHVKIPLVTGFFSCVELCHRPRGRLPFLFDTDVLQTLCDADHEKEVPA